MKPTWHMHAEGSITEYDDWIPTGGYYGAKNIWKGAEETLNEYQSQNTVRLQLNVHKDIGGWFGKKSRIHHATLKIQYRGFQLTLREWKTTSVARSCRQADWTWRHMQGEMMPALLKTVYSQENWRCVFKLDGSPFASMLRYSGNTNPGTILPNGDYILKDPNNSLPSTLHVASGSTCGHYGLKDGLPPIDPWLQKAA